MSRHFAYCNTAKAFEYAVKKADFSIVEEGDLELACLILNESLKFVECLVDAQVVQVVLDKARELFSEVEGTAPEQELSAPEEVSQRAPRLASRSVHITSTAHSAAAVMPAIAPTL